MTTETKLIPLTDRHIQLLADRGINDEIAMRLGWQSCDRKGDWISIPFYRDGKAVNHKYRTLSGDKKFTQDKGGEQCFYNIDAFNDVPAGSTDFIIVITEGEMDCAIALQCGFVAVSVPNGAPAERADDDSIKFNFLKEFPRNCIAILATDDDGPGHILRQELALRLGWHRCKTVKYPKGCKDLNEVFVKYGAKGVNMVLKDKASFLNQGGIFTIDDLPLMPDVPAYECGIGNATDMIKVRPGDAIFVTGIPSHGKTTFVNCLTANMAKNHGWNCCIGSFEQNPRGEHLEFLRRYYLDKESKHATAKELAEADAWVNEKFSFIVPDINSDELTSLKWVLERTRAAIMRYGARLVVIDPWNELDHDRPNGMSLTEYTGYAIKEFKRLAKQYMVAVIIVAHPSKMEKNKSGGYGIPTLYDISDSAHWANKADIGVIIHRCEGDDGKYATLVRVSKVRYWGVIGKIGDRYFEYLPERGKYIDYPDFQPKGRKKKAKTEAE